MTAAPLPPISGPLLAWYDRHKRSMPWRDRPDPYRVWVSEIMLQQTRVETVLPYFERFLAALPDIAALAAAPEDRLLKLWEGLGYYSRARNLQHAARVVMEELGGVLPSDPDVLARLPGIGPYTAGAIASIAYGVSAPAVDGNVLRVVTRLTADATDIGGQSFRREVAARLIPLIPPERAGDFTQALMELGACVCLPNGAPLCAECPLADFCAALRRGDPTGFPVRAAAQPRKVEDRTVLVVIAGEGILVRRRPDTGLLAGLWEFPHVEGRLNATEAKEAVAEWGARPATAEALPGRRHIFSHLEWRLTGFLFRSGPFAPPTGWRWVPWSALHGEYALPAAFAPYLDLCGRIEE